MTTTTEATAAPETAASHDLGAERIVLGAMMLTPTAIEDAVDILDPDDFYTTKHQTIFRAIIGRYADGDPTDLVSITDRLLDTGDLIRIGGAPYLHDLVDAVPVTASAGWYARRIAEAAGRRRLTEAAITIGQAAASAGLSLAEAQDRAAETLNTAITSRNDAEPVRIGNLVTTALDRIEAAGKTTGIRGLTTGLVDLDKLTGGLQGGRVYVIAGRPGMGKSVCGLDIARHNSIRGNVPGLLTTLEMSRDEVVDRILSAETSIPHHFIQSGNLNDNNWTTLARAAAALDQAPLFIDDTEVNLIQLRTRARKLQQRHGLGYLVVDYLQLMPAPSGGRDRNREREVAELSRGIKLLAKELNIPVIAISQLNRAADSRTDKRPSLADLRESGAVEQDADVAVLLYRDDYYHPESERSGEVDLIVAKNRHGAQDTVTAAAQLHCMRFADMSPAALN